VEFVYSWIEGGVCLLLDSRTVREGEVQLFVDFVGAEREWGAVILGFGDRHCDRAGCNYSGISER
jgi:hypothetical protein